MLARGSSTPVHHTLKSKLAEDATRAMYGIAPAETLTAAGAAAPPRFGSGARAGAGMGGIAAATAAAGAGATAVPFFPPASLLVNPRAAAHEVALRREMGLPVTADLAAARVVAAPQAARRVVRVRLSEDVWEGAWPCDVLLALPVIGTASGCRLSMPQLGAGPWGWTKFT